MTRTSGWMATAAMGLVLGGCATMAERTADQTASATMVAPVLTTPDAVDAHSYARPAEARVTHVALDLLADFAAKTMSGTATLDVQSAPGIKELVLDTRDLAIRSVTDGNGAPLPYTVGARDPIHGAALTVTHDGARQVRIAYSSAPGAPALQWLSPDQTAGKAKPFLFSQGEAILNRSWIPTQDSPGIRQSWDATITVPADLTAVMSAEMLTPGGEPAGAGTHRFRFRMDKPVAPYLIALAVGDLKFQSLGPRTGVWAEPVTLAKAASEFRDLEGMVTTAEGLYGPYRWGRYDLLVLPPSFPFGGMENPRLTFVTPTVLAGDRSLVSLVAHELAHSWSGNLVTNATWDDFWLNEGFTVYFENRIMEALYGPERSRMLADLGWSDMESAITEAGGPTGADTRLHLDLAGRDPDDGMTDVAYEKGATFLRTLEAAVGRPRWDTYLKGYFARHAFQPQTTAGFRADLLANLFKGGRAGNGGRPGGPVALSAGPAVQRRPHHLARLRPSGRAGGGRPRRPDPVGGLDDAGAAALPQLAPAPAVDPPAGAARQALRAVGHRQQRAALCLAATGAAQRLRPGARVGRTVPAEPRPPQVRRPAVHDADGAEGLGTGAGEVDLCPRATGISFDHDWHRGPDTWLPRREFSGLSVATVRKLE